MGTGKALTPGRINNPAQGSAGRSQPPSADRITVALIPKVGDDLHRLQERTGLSKTDLVNRAITLYEFVEAQLAAGRDLLVRDSESGELQTVLIL